MGYTSHEPHLQDNVVQLATVKCDRTFSRISQFEIPVTLQSFSVHEVYRLSSDSWQRVMLGRNISISNIGYDLPVPFVNGVLHWMICMSESEKEPQAAKILTFDVNN